MIGDDVVDRLFQYAFDGIGGIVILVELGVARVPVVERNEAGEGLAVVVVPRLFNNKKRYISDLHVDQRKKKLAF